MMRHSLRVLQSVKSEASLFVLFGMDTHGTTRVVRKFDTMAEAIQAQDQLTEQVHKQHFWIEKENVSSSTSDGTKLEQ